MSFLPNDKLEAALVALLAAPVAAVNPACSVVAGGSPGDRALPEVICAVDGDGEEEPKSSGNFWLNAMVTLKTKATTDDSATPEADRQALASAIYGVLYVDGLPALLSAAASDFFVFPLGVTFSAPTRGQDGDAWFDQFPLRVYCCASDLS